MIIGYAGVSTQDQNTELQVDALEKAGVEQVFQEKFTGKLREGPELSQCLRTLRKGDILVVWKLDRLARSLKDMVEIVQDLHDREIGFKSLTESIDTTSSGGRLVFHIFGALAEFEHDLIRERTIAGLNAARARGRKGGRKPAMSDADVKKAAALLLDLNITKKKVAEHFGVTRTTPNASLKRIEPSVGKVTALNSAKMEFHGGVIPTKPSVFKLQLLSGWSSVCFVSILRKIGYERATLLFKLLGRRRLLPT